jgi:SAM-dependent methyltransferase
MIPPVELLCPDHMEKLAMPAGDGPIECPRGCHFPRVRSIPRFVSSDNYAAAFGSQWKAFRRTQLDSYTGATISRDRLQRCVGGSLDTLRGKLVLEAGCGAGRFTEVLLQSGARVFACDLSEAVEANHDNCGGAPGYFCCQADIARLPVKPGQFDWVICLGVIQHTPDPEKTLFSLARQLKPGGWLVVDHYTGKVLLKETQTVLRRFLLSRSPEFTLRFCGALVGLLWPLHRYCWRIRATRSRLLRLLRAAFLRLSPVFDYHPIYPQLEERLLHSWAVLDTHDALTDRYKHTRTLEEITAALGALGLSEITAAYGGNGVEARARKPAPA